jgi:NAD+ diphosphatase
MNGATTAALGFAEAGLDRCANFRTDEAWLARALADPRSRFVKVYADRVAVAGGKLATERPPAIALAILLGRDRHGDMWFACPTEESSANADLRSLALEAVLPPLELAAAAQARSLVHWHLGRRFCSGCGAHTVSVDAGYRRHCPSCGASHFPRTDPVVIMVVRHEGRLLLGRQKSWAPGVYSALAGFMEPGETIEDAARREIFEEAGIGVGEVRYVASQPWPFPSSLMIGLIGEALSDAIAVDYAELEDARWFAAEDARLMLRRVHPDGLVVPNPMAIAHRLVAEAAQSP